MLTQKLLKKINIFLFISLTACAPTKEDDVKPDYVLSEDKFTKLLVDFALAESASNLNVKNVSAEKIDSTYAFNPLKENNVTLETYDSSLSYYSKHPDLYKKIYENVLVELNKMKSPTNELKADSIKNNQSE